MNRFAHFGINQKGFTIVELLIVIVVIGILAAITLVAYNGITTQANAKTAQGNAQSVKSVVDTYYGEKGSYPAVGADVATTTTNVNAGAYSKLPSAVSLVITGTMTASNTNVYYVAKGSPATGACIGYKPANTSTIQWVYAGNATTGTEGASPACA